MAGLGLITREFFYTSMFVSFAFMVAIIAMVWRWLPRQADRWLALILILSSKAFVDYSSSGLEYPLSYFLLTLFVMRISSWDDAAPLPEQLPPLLLIASLAFVNRADTILLYFPALVWLLWRRIRELRLADLGRLALASAPAWGWLLFSLIYYGFPFPNTYYAKAAFGAPRWLQLQQGAAYVVSSLRFDPL